MRGLGSAAPPASFYRLAFTVGGTLLLAAALRYSRLPPLAAGCMLQAAYCWLQNERHAGPACCRAGGLFLAAPPLYRLAKCKPLAEDSRTRWKNLCIMLVWQPLAWLAAGGGWVALLGVWPGGRGARGVAAVACTGRCALLQTGGAACSAKRGPAPAPRSSLPFSHSLLHINHIGVHIASPWARAFQVLASGT